jgi:predicted PurR-regulated permease PerM
VFTQRGADPQAPWLNEFLVRASGATEPFMPPRLPLFTASSSEARTAALQGLLIAAIVITGLYVGREVLLPLALAVLLSFVLTPMLLLLRRLKFPRVLSVLIVVSFFFGLIFAVGWLMTQQASQLAEELPRYEGVLADKIRALRYSAASGPVLENATDALKGLQRELSNPKAEPMADSSGPAMQGSPDKPIPVEVHEPPQPLELFQKLAGTLLPPLVTAGIVILFVIFILLQREDLRDRAIRLLGASDMQRATAAMNDAATRLSKYFLRQVLINSAYGVFIALGLWLIGVPSPIVWGILAMLMRFVPYVGSFIAAAFPLILAAAVDPGWGAFLLTLTLYLISELTMGQVVEPLVYGHGTGVSPIAVVLSTVFWTWLWGPLGLLLAMPLTVCLVAIGNHVEGLNFFEVLLGDEPALTPQQSFYQRTLTGDSAEATYQAELALKDEPLAAYLDDVALKALQLAERDSERGALDMENLECISLTVQEIMENLSDFEPRRWFRKVEPVEKKADAEEAQTGLASLSAMDEAENDSLPILEPADLAPGWQDERSVLCIGGRTPLDDAAAIMLAGLLEKHGLKARALDHEAISAGHIVSLDAANVRLVCLSYLGLGGSAAHVRYLVRRLRRLLPEESKILVAYWAEDPGSTAVNALEQTADADFYGTSLRETAELVIQAARGPKLEPVVPEVEQIKRKYV